MFDCLFTNVQYTDHFMINMGMKCFINQPSHFDSAVNKVCCKFAEDANNSH